MFGLFGKKSKDAPQPIFQSSSGTLNTTTWQKVCQLLGYKSMTTVCETGYFFITKNFCCAVNGEGILYGGLDPETSQPYKDRFVMRPFEVGAIETEALQINDNGTELVSLKLFYADSNREYAIFIPCNDFHQFEAALRDAIDEDAILRDMMGEDRYGSFQ